MRKAEDKLKYILPNGAKQAIKIKFSRKKIIAIGDNMHELGVVFQVIKMVEEVCEEK